jgi:hypothetical protein
MRKTILLTALLAMTAQPAQSDDAPKELNALYDRVQKVISTTYPKATFERNGTLFTAKYKTRKFMIHLPLKTGEWQEARETEGPDRGGIMCSIQYSKGKFMGAAMVPQTFDRFYYQSHLMAPYNKKLDAHLIAHLNYPANTPPEVLTQWTKTVESFAQE